MPRALTIAILIVAGLQAAGPARAEPNCWVPITVWQPRSAVKALAKTHGWSMRRILVDDGCYEMLGLDADGKRIEVRLRPNTLEILAIRKLNGSAADVEAEGPAGGKPKDEN